MNMTRADDRRLRILLAIESCSGGSARHVVDLADGLIQEGHNVEVVYSPLRADSWFLRELEALPGLVMHPIQMHRNLGAHDLQSVKDLRALLNRRQPFDIMHGHSAKAGALIRLAGIGKDTVKIYTPHAFITLDPGLGAKKRLLYTVAERCLAPLADGIVCVSDEESEHAKGLGIDENLLFTVENGLASLPAADRAAARSKLALADSDVCFGFVGRISEQKSVDRFVRAFHLLHLQFPEAIAVIVGDGPDYDDLRRLARALNLDERIRFTGSADGVFLMSGFDVFVLPSVYEAFPYVYLEALSRSLPIISTAVGGAGAVVDHGKNGFVVPQEQLELLLKYIAMLSVDRDLRDSMSRKSRQKSELFTVKRMVDQTVGVYRQLLASRG
jgi:glycosyltransferase involved in cell wall biosynthesis